LSGVHVLYLFENQYKDVLVKIKRRNWYGYSVNNLQYDYQWFQIKTRC
jgi:hypothetical protein